jgi:hypothetical protein
LLAMGVHLPLNFVLMDAVPLVTVVVAVAFCVFVVLSYMFTFGNW